MATFGQLEVGQYFLSPEFNVCRKTDIDHAEILDEDEEFSEYAGGPIAGFSFDTEVTLLSEAVAKVRIQNLRKDFP
jgi:hypothetical protein